MPPQGYSLFRLTGVIEGETYNRLMPTPDSNQPITLTGGYPLVSKIQLDIEADAGDNSAELQQEFKNFIRDYYDPPAYYHVFFERVGNKSLKTIHTSTDIREGCPDFLINQRHVSWYWSDSDFSIHAKANGPVLSLVSG